MKIRVNPQVNRLVWFSYTALNMLWFWPLLIMDHLIERVHARHWKLRGEQWIRHTRWQITGMD